MQQRLGTIFGLLALLLLVTCSQKNPGNSTQKVTLTLTREGLSAAGTGGVMIWGKNPGKDRVLAVALPAGQSSATFELETGVWDFAAIAWDGPSELEGTSNCFILTGREITGDEASININLTDSNGCENNSATNQAAFYNQGSQPLDGSGNWAPVHITSCVDFTDVTATPSANTSCSDAQESGDFRSYRIVLLNQLGAGPPGPGLKGACHATTDVSVNGANIVLDQSANLTRIPVGTGQFPIPTRIEAFKDSTCGQGGENFDFPDGLAFPGFNFSSLFHPSVSYTNDRPLLVLPGAAGPGGGSSPLTSILPSWLCNGSYCGPPALSTFGHFSYFAGFTGLNDPIKFYVDATAVGDPACSAHSGGGSDITVTACDCSESHGQCFRTLIVTAITPTCTGPLPCLYNQQGDGEEDEVKIGTASIMIADPIGRAVEVTREIFFNIFGTEDGRAYQLDRRYDPRNIDPGKNQNDNFGAIGEIREFLGPGELGGELAKQGFENCQDLGDPNFNNSFLADISDDPGKTSTAQIDISSGQIVIPDRLLVSGTNTTGSKFEKRVKIFVTETGGTFTETEEIILEFNCPGNNTGGFMGAIIMRENSTDSVTNGDTINRLEKRIVFYNTSDQNNKRLETVEVLEEYFTNLAPADQLQRKTWFWTTVNNPGTVNGSKYNKAGATRVEYGKFNGPGSPADYFQFRGAFALDTASVTPAYALQQTTIAPSGNGYVDNATSASTADFGAATQTCVDRDKLEKVGYGIGCVDSGLFDFGGINPMFTQLLGETDNTSMNFVGKPINCSGDAAIPSSEMECLMDEFLENVGI